MAFTNKINKLVDFLKSWETTSILYTDEKKMSNDVNKMLNDKDNKENLKVKSKVIIDEVKENFKYIREVIENGK